jgi:GT2 family glycosyltransferase
MKYSIIIVSYNCLRYLRECIQSVQAHSEDYEIIVVDNASTDGTDRYISENGSVYEVCESENTGFAPACNEGAKEAQGEYLVFLNPDTLVTPDWLPNMSKYFLMPKIGAVGPVSNYVAGAQKYEWYCEAPNRYLDASANEFSRHIRNRNYCRYVENKFLIGFCMMIPRSIFQEIGGMDADLFLGNDDLDLSWRLRIAGYKLIIATDVFIHHAGGKSFESEDREETEKQLQESADILYRKLERHYGIGKVPASMELWGMDWFRGMKK